MTIKEGIDLSSGIYTLPDAALILRIPLSKLRRWIVTSEKMSDGFLESWGSGKDRAFDFNELIEAYTVYSLRNLGVTMPKIKLAHQRLSAHFKTKYPFAKKGILTDGKAVLFDIGGDVVLNVSQQIQGEFKELIRQFCINIDFDSETELARKFWPLGKRRLVVVDPRHSFGRPVIVGTNITSEVIFSMTRGGVSFEDISFQYEIGVEAVKDAVDFHMMAA